MASGDCPYPHFKPASYKTVRIPCVTLGSQKGGVGASSAALKALEGVLRRSLSPTAVQGIVLLALHRMGGSEYLSGATT
jgi:hypothetical protein